MPIGIENSHVRVGKYLHPYTEKLSRGRLKGLIFVALPLLLLLHPLRTDAQNRQSAIRARYGPYPIAAAGLNRLRADLRKDKLLFRANKQRCKSMPASRKSSVCDYDRDGLINSRERMLGTKLANVDSDSDGLRDRAELLNYHTDPLSADTDGDGMSDGDEVLNGRTDPTSPDSPADCSKPNFDEGGETSGFGIPAPLIGNISRGTQAFTQRCAACHAGAEKGTNYSFPALKTRISQAPMFITSIDNPVLADLVAYLNRTQTGFPAGCDGRMPTPTPIPGQTPTPSGPSCANQYFDANGNTIQFGIPNPLAGNISRGSSYYALHCSSCHSDRGAGFTFAQVKSAVTGPLMNIATVTDPDFADLTAYMNRALANIGCNGNPTPTPTPARTPTPTPTPFSAGCANDFFDAAGNTTQFGIPAPLIGTIGAGQGIYGVACTSCHVEKGTNFTFAQLKTAVTGPLMKITTVSDQQFAHITAYLNRSKAAQNCGTPVPTPTPLSDIAAGQLIYQTTCQSCHARPSKFRTLESQELSSKLREVSEMRSIRLTNEQIRVLLIYFHSIP